MQSTVKKKGRHCCSVGELKITFTSTCNHGCKESVFNPGCLTCCFWCWISHWVLLILSWNMWLRGRSGGLWLGRIWKLFCPIIHKTQGFPNKTLGFQLQNPGFCHKTLGFASKTLGFDIKPRVLLPKLRVLCETQGFASKTQGFVTKPRVLWFFWITEQFPGFRFTLTKPKVLWRHKTLGFVISSKTRSFALLCKINK